MSRNRLGFGLAIGLYLLTIGRPVADPAMAGLACWGGLAFAGFLHCRLWPERSRMRRGVALLLDMGFLSWFLHIGGAVAAPFFPVYIWVALGNGFRFGNRWLLAAMALFVAGFGWVALATPFWQAQPHLVAGLLLGPCILGPYAAVLIRKLSQAKRQAELASEAKSLFLASVSHELRTPLNAIIGMGGLLRESRLDAEQQEMARTIDGAARSLLSLIDGILDFSRIEAGATAVRPEEFDLLALLAEVRRLLLVQAREKGLDLRIHVTPRLPARILCDRGHLRDILLNLAGNAVKFTESGGVVIAADAEEPAPGLLRLRFEVTDTGIGIRQEALGRIFEHFAQADASIASRFGGTGLGLAICKGLVRLLGGEIGVESQPGQGSTFWFTADARRAAGEGEQHPPAGLSVLIETAEPAAAMPLHNGLTGLGAEVASRMMEPAAMARLWGEGAAPAHLLLCERQDGGAGAERLRIAIGGATTEGLPPPEIRRRAAMLLPAHPSPAELQAAMRVAAALLLPEAQPDGRQPLAPSARRGLRVLVADDNRVNRRVVQKILERAGHAVQLAGNGEEALDALEAGGFDLVLMDVNMPVLDGIEATKLYRFAALGRPHLPILGLTADATPEAARRCREAGMDACLTKPVEPARLVEAVESLARPSAESSPVVAEVPTIASHPRFRPAMPALDPQVLADLEALGGPDFVAGLTEDFLQEAVQLLQAMRVAAGQGDARRFRAEAHALRSSAANMGARAIHELCGAAEAMDAAAIAAAGARQVALLAAELERVREARPAVPARAGCRS